MTFQSGALVDARTESEKQKDYTFGEIVASTNPVTWIEKPQDQWRKFPIFSQNGSGSCVAQTESKELGIMRYLKDGIYVHFSADHIYQQRTNKPVPGMSAIDARTAAQNGVTLEVLAPSQNMNDAQMDSYVIDQYKKDVGSVFCVPNYVHAPIKDIDTVASIIQTTGKGVMVWFYFNIDEWTGVPQVLHDDISIISAQGRHSITAVDPILYQGKKALVIEDSWGPGAGIGGQRVITEDFFNARNFYSGYLVNFKFDENVSKPHYVFLKDLEFNPVYFTDPDVVALQDILKFEGMFPTNQSSTGYFGAVTKTAVQKYQVKYGIAKEGDLGYGRVGPKTRADLNSRYGQ